MRSGTTEQGAMLYTTLSKFHARRIGRRRALLLANVCGHLRKDETGGWLGARGEISLHKTRKSRNAFVACNMPFLAGNRPACCPFTPQPCVVPSQYETSVITYLFGTDLDNCIPRRMSSSTFLICSPRGLLKPGDKSIITETRRGHKRRGIWRIEGGKNSG